MNLENYHIIYQKLDLIKMSFYLGMRKKMSLSKLLALQSLNRNYNIEDAWEKNKRTGSEVQPIGDTIAPLVDNVVG